MNIPFSPSPAVVRALFTRGIAFVYAVAFVSLWRQVHGLIGTDGILPVGRYLESAAGQLGRSDAVLRLPTLLWFDAGNMALHLLCAGGTLAALLALTGAAPAICLALCWICYLSLVHAGQVFLSYQWDILLLEAGFLAILWTPLTLRPLLIWPGVPPRGVVWVSRWLLFRLMWSSGVVKLLSGDPTWRNLTATTFHYETQPIPVWTSHYFHHLPPWVHAIEVLSTFGVELVLPLAIFGPRRWRLAAAAGFVGLQLVIALTGNYGFFNVLSLVLCLPLILDTTARQAAAVRRWPGAVVVPVTALLFVLGAANLTRTMGLQIPGTGWLQPLRRALAPLHLSGGYGLFASMTTKRPEIVVEGSLDGSTWQAYEFRWKPTDPDRRPTFAVLHMPRLDWQLWFAALRGYNRAPWFGHLAARLLEGSPVVLGLLEADPFAGTPPQYLRARLFDYHFSTPAQRAHGTWWRRSRPRPYTPVLSLREPRGR